MEVLKKAKEKMKERGVVFPGQSKFLQLGIKKEGGGVESTGFHKVKLLEEPLIVKEPHYHSGISRQVVRYKLEEDGEEKIWSHPLYKEKEGKPVKDESGNYIAHYLIEGLENIEVGDWFGLQMKGSKGKNFVRVTYPLKEKAKEKGEEIDIDNLGEDVDIDDLGDLDEEVDFDSLVEKEEADIDEEVDINDLDLDDDEQSLS